MTPTRFCPWYPLRDGGAHACHGPGVYQIRVPAGLVSYPRGKSAMIHYGAGRDVRAAIAAFAAAHPGRDWLCRHWELSAGADPDQACEDLVAAFARRFGQTPSVPDKEAP